MLRDAAHSAHGRARSGFRVAGLSVPAALTAAGVLLLTVVVRYVLALDQTAPWLMGDELRYAEMAKSFLEEGRLLFREQFTSFASAYPALISPGWAASDIETAYEFAKAVNVVLMTCSAVVVFFWTRRLGTTAFALAAAGLVLLMPTFTYTGMLMTENAAVPAFLLAAFLMAVALERGSVALQLAAIGAIALAALLRVQVATLALVFPAAIVLDAWLARCAGTRPVRESLRRFVPAVVALASGALLYLVYIVLSGGSLTSGLGAYDAVAGADYDVLDVVRWAVWHVGELVLSVGVLPALALVALVASAARQGGLASPAERAFVAVGAIATVAFVLQAAAFASRFSGRIEERYMVYTSPLLLMALVVWVARERERARLAAVVGCAACALFALTIPFERLFNVGLFGDTFGLIPFMRLSTFLDAGVEDLRIVVAAGLAAAVALFLALPWKVARVALPSVVAGFLLLSGYTVHGTIRDQSQATRAAQGAADPSWVDHAVGDDARVGFVYGPNVSSNPHLLWQAEFWNRSIDNVYVHGTDPDPSYSNDEIRIDAHGRLVPKEAGDAQLEEPYLVADPALGIVGEVVAQPGPIALIQLDPPARVEQTLDGVYGDGWSGPNAALNRYAPLSGGARRIKVDVSRAGWDGPDLPGRVEIRVGPLRMMGSDPSLARVTAARQWTVHSKTARSFVLPLPPAPFRVEVSVTPTFSPAQFGHGDARQLGAQLGFSPA
ncbi:MAG: hypothetical protein ACRDNH_01295 [Gaiellaceae bacterium]